MSASPRLEFGAPEVRIVPDATHLADAGLSARDLGLTVDAFNNGIRVDEVLVDGRFMDLILAGSKAQSDETRCRHHVRSCRIALEMAVEFPLEIPASQVWLPPHDSTMLDRSRYINCSFAIQTSPHFQ